MYTNKTYHNGRSTKVPSKIRVSNDGRACETNKIGDGGVEKVDGRDKTSHIRWCARVSNAVGGNVDKNFGDTTESEWNSHPPNGDGSNKTQFSTASRTSIIAARALLVGVVVENGISGASDGRDCETSGNACDWTILNAPLTERWVKDVVNKRGSHNDGERVEVVDDVVWHTVGDEHGREEVCCRTDTVVVKVLNGEETEDTSSLESATDVLDELIVPPSRIR